MQTKLQFKVSLAEDTMETALEFYKSCGRVTNLNPKDILVFGRAGERLVGIVRLCHEHGHYVLRTMQVLEELQGQGYGRQILEKFKKLLAEQAIQEVYCMPYAHLEKFYGLIDFKKIPTEQAPEFLQERVAEFHKKHPDKSAILMKKSE